MIKVNCLVSATALSFSSKHARARKLIAQRLACLMQSRLTLRLGEPIQLGSALAATEFIGKLSIEAERGYFLYALLALYCLLGEVQHRELMIKKVQEHKQIMLRMIKLAPIHHDMMVRCLTQNGQYQLALIFTADVSRDRMVRGWCYYKLGFYHRSLSYFEGYLKSIEQKTRPIWLKRRAAI